MRSGQRIGCYDVTADGERFLVNTMVEGARPIITWVLNWTAELEQ